MLKHTAEIPSVLLKNLTKYTNEDAKELSLLHQRTIKNRIESCKDEENGTFY